MTEPNDQESLYHVEPVGDRFSVVDDTGQAVVTSTNAANAEQYAVLLNQAYRRGYKAGLRHARRG